MRLDHYLKGDMENWKAVEGYEGRYEISNLGRVKSLLRGEKILVPLIVGHKPDNVYFVVTLHKDSQQKQKSIHRLVAKEFIPNERNLPIVNHKDENTFNNAESNLEWCTSQYNQEYSLSKKIYKVITPDGNHIDIKNMRKFCRENNLNHGHMYQVVQNKMKSHKGYRSGYS